MHRVDQRYLGPPGKTFVVKIRYKAYGVGVGVFLAVTVILRGFLQIPWSSQSTLILVAAVILITSRIMKTIDADKTVESVSRAAINDLTAPRPRKAAARGRHRVAPLPSARLRHRETETA